MTAKLELIEGKRLEGKVAIINFWATWCQPCLVELPHLDRMHKELGKKGFVVVAISTDSPKTIAKVRTYIHRYAYSFPVLLDKDGHVSRLLNPVGQAPYSIVLDRLGRVRIRHEGYQPGDEKILKKKVVTLLAESKR